MASRVSLAGAPCGGLNACGARAADGVEVSGLRIVLLLPFPQHQSVPKAGTHYSAITQLVLSSLLPWRLP